VISIFMRRLAWPPAGEGLTILHAKTNFSKYSAPMYRIGN
jgi:hypothetical protein